MATIVIFGDAADGEISSQNNNYTTARTGSGLGASSAAAFINIGEPSPGPPQIIYEGFISFDTSTLVGVSIISAILSLVDNLDASGTDFVIECRLSDWSTTVDTTDWVAGQNLGSLTLLATYSTVTGWVGNIYHDFTNVAMVANINTAGFTRMLLASDNLRLGNAPSIDQFLQFKSADTAGTTSDPKLTITSSTPIVYPPVNIIPQLRMR